MLRRKDHGFTLIELLVVMAIIAILAAILFPVFARAREAARKITCVSNARQLALGVLMYANDNGEMFPGVHNDDNDGAGHPVNALTAAACALDPNSGGNCHNDVHQWQLADVLFPYLKNDDVYTCPTIGDKMTRLATVEVPTGSGVWLQNKSNDSGSYHWICFHIVPDPTLIGTPVDDTTLCGPYEVYQLAFAAQNILYAIPAFKKISLPEPPAANAFPCSNPGSWYSACAQAQGDIADAGRVPIIACNSFGQHEGYTGDETDCMFPPPELRALLELLDPGGCQGCIDDGVFTSMAECLSKPFTGATVFAYADGHAKYERLTFYDMWDTMFGSPIFQ